MKNFFCMNRVVGIGNRFVYQTRGMLFFWRGVDKEEPGRFTIWYDKYSQKEYCSFDSFKEANEYMYSLTIKTLK